MRLEVSCNVVSATNRSHGGYTVLNNFSSCTDFIFDNHKLAAYFIADVGGREEWNLYVTYFREGLTRTIVRTAGPKLALSDKSNSFYFKVTKNGEKRTVRCDVGKTLCFSFDESFLNTNTVQIVKLSDPIVKRDYVCSPGMEMAIVPINFDFSGVSLRDVACTSIRPHNRQSSAAFERFLKSLDDTKMETLHPFQGKDPASVFAKDGRVQKENSKRNAKYVANVLNTYGVYGRSLKNARSFKYCHHLQLFRETSLDDFGSGPEEYSNSIIGSLQELRGQNLPVFASTVSAGAIPLVLAAIRTPDLCDGIIVSKGLRLPTSGQFYGKVDKIHIRDRLSSAAIAELESKSVIDRISAPALVLSADCDSRLLPEERCEARSPDSSTWSFEHRGGHLAASPEVELAVELLRAFFIKQVVD